MNSKNPTKSYSPQSWGGKLGLLPSTLLASSKYETHSTRYHLGVFEEGLFLFGPNCICGMAGWITALLLEKYFFLEATLPSRLTC